MGSFVLDGWGESELAVESFVVGPVDVLGNRDLQVVNAPPRLAIADQLGLEQAVERLSESAVVGVAFVSDGRDNADSGDFLGVADGVRLDVGDVANPPQFVQGRWR